MLILFLATLLFSYLFLGFLLAIVDFTVDRQMLAHSIVTKSIWIRSSIKCRKCNTSPVYTNLPSNNFYPQSCVRFSLNHTLFSFLSYTSYRIPYGPHLIPSHLCRDLEVAKTCDCGRVCVNFFIKTAVSMNLHKVSHTVVLVDDMGGTDAPVQRHFCSLSCYSEFLDICLQRGIR